MSSLLQETVNPAQVRLTLNRPEKRNAFDAALIDELLQAFQALADQPQVRVIELAAKGKHFSAGADLNWMRAQGQQSEAENYAGAQQLARLLQQIDRQPQVVIARVQGAAFGGALGLIAASHIAVAAEDARFCLSEVRLGLLPAVIGPYVVRALGARQARRYMSTAELIDAPTALRLNLVHEVVAGDQLDSVCATIADKLLQGAPSAQQQVPALIATCNQPVIDEPMIDSTCQLIARLRTADEGQEGMGAFLEKRPAHWRKPHDH